MRDTRGRGDDGVHPGCNRTWSAFPPSRRAPCVQDPRPERRWWDGGPGAPSADRSGNDHTRGAHLSRPSRAPRCYPQGSARPSPRSGGGSAGSPAPPAGRARLWSALPVSHQPPPPALFPHGFLAGSSFPRKVKNPPLNLSQFVAGSKCDRDENLPLRFRVVHTGDSQLCRYSPLSTNSSIPTPVTPISICSGGRIARSSAPGVTATMSVPGGPIITGQGSNATGAKTVGGPSTTSPTRCWPRASGRFRIGSWPPSCCACRVRRVALRESWGYTPVQAIAGAGGCVMPLCPMRRSDSWKAPLKPMTSTIPPATKGKRNRVGRNRWGAERVVAV